MPQNKNIISNGSDNTNVGGAEMENISTDYRQTTAYDFDNSHYEIVRIFSKSRELNTIIEERISLSEEVDSD